MASTTIKPQVDNSAGGKFFLADSPLRTFLLGLLLASVTSALVIAARRHRYLPVGWFWFLGTLVPMIGLLEPSQQGMADRFVYQAYLGLFIIVCRGVADWAKQRRVPIAWPATAGALALLALTMVTYRQIGYWQDHFMLWTHAVQVVPYHWEGESTLGIYLMENGKSAEAMQHFYRAYAINPDDARSNLEIGYYEQTRGNPQQAIFHYERALRANNFALRGSSIPVDKPGSSLQRYWGCEKGS